MELLTKDISDDYFPDLASIALRLSTPDSLVTAHDMMSVQMSEAGVRANAHNPNGDASGLIQFMPKTLTNLGWFQGHEAFRKLSAVEQLPFVEKYYKPYVGHLDSVGGLYVATFLPAFISHATDKDFVLTAKNGPLGWAYGPNAVFDKNKDFAITVGELEDAVRRNCVGARWAQLEARLTGNGISPSEHNEEILDLGTIIGLQMALVQLGLNPGPIDGIPGPLTYSAVAAYQQMHGLTVDGIYGPLTRAALESDCK